MSIKTSISLITLSISLISALPTKPNGYPVNSGSGPIAEYYPDDYSIYGNLDANPWDFVIPTTSTSNSDNDQVQTKPNPIVPQDVQTKPLPITEPSTQANPTPAESSEGADINEQKNTRKPLSRRQYDFDNDPQFNGQKVNSDTFWDAAKTVPSILGWVSKM
ncbi:hypothetical protein CONCODRAFT_9950 [Conidiobolus coronatus NRRL 28638]|uniref:Uncharacterized protein n=1 Tax=Conidiobolus coronatus (strain ATCC 28846 / CBS 209.66 / NRRL 28638) TaxID=796925 RepID=A0A137NYM1_CONC2|nr:hypothetical protein CONCODRAFT_9950 [Conidiobolus coronatus NRRL 28638]|eukprot:KXN67886.1 hypothetical protein CONCODRAFT_9950 [Conidiobolus coronatus NRRL 28638]